MLLGILVDMLAYTRGLVSVLKEQKAHPPGGVIIVHRGNGDVDDAPGAIKSLLERIISQILVHTRFEMLSIQIHDFVIEQQP